MAQTVACYFERPDGQYNLDWQPEIKEKEERIWKLVVYTDQPDTEMTLSWEESIKAVPDTIILSIRKKGEEEWQDMRAIRKIKLTSSGLVTKEEYEIKAEYKAELQVTTSVLLQSYPNPTNGAVWIPFKLSANSDQVSVSIYNIIGQKVKTIDVGPRKAGSYTQAKQGSAIFWDNRNFQGEPVASGLYFYQLKADKFSAVGKMVVGR